MSSITLSNLSYALPDGRPLLKDLSLTFGAERAGLVGRNGVGKTTLLRLIAGEAQPQGGSVGVSGRLAYLRQVAQPDAGLSMADVFGVTAALDALRRAERGDASADELAHVDWTLEARMAAALARVGLDAAADARLEALSGGQRTRAALASLLFAEPDFLLLDEPTNNLDADGRDAVIELLAEWRKGAIIVSHDRDLLEEMDAIVELTTLGAKRYGGGWSAYRAQKDVELAAAQADLADAEKRVADVARGAQVAAERKARKDRMGKAKAMRGDMPRILIGALKERSENTGASATRMIERRRDEAESDARVARERIEVLQKLKLSLPSTGLAASKVVLELDDVTAGYDPGEAIIDAVSFKLVGPERVAVVGPNGSGKTTLLSVISRKLKPWRGHVRVLTDFAMFDQDVSLLDRGQTVLENFRRINVGANENACRAALARFMFRADAAHQVAGTLSGGQLLRAGLACVLGGETPPPLLILDEPTNHLDIDSIEAIEAALSAYDGALLVVSHDAAFLKAIGVMRRVELFRHSGRAERDPESKG